MLILFSRILILLIIIATRINPADGIGAPSNIPIPYAYAIRYGMINLSGKSLPIAYLDQINIQTDTIFKTIRIDSGYNSVSVLDDRSVILCNTTAAFNKSGADVMDIEQGKILFSFRLEGTTPRMAIATKDKVIFITVKEEQSSSSGSIYNSFEIFDRYSFNKIGDINLRNGENIDERISLGPDRKNIFFIGWNPTFYPDSSQGLMGKIDIISIKPSKQLDYVDLFGGGRWIASAGKKVYVSAVDATSKEEAKPHEKRKLNDKLFVFDYDDLSLIKTIPIGVLAEQLVYVPVVNRLYIAHSSWDQRTPQYIEVLDCEKDQIIDKIAVKGFRRMSYVGNHKLYVSHSGGPLFGSSGKGGILVIDVRTNKLLKNIPGEYAPISYNFFPIDDLSEE